MLINVNQDQPIKIILGIKDNKIIWIYKLY